MPVKTIIIEDEEKSLYVLQEMISQFAFDLEVCGTASYTHSAVKLIETTMPDLIFLDICIADGTGFDILRQISTRNFELIFITAYDNYAVEAFRFAAIDYLLKPIGIQEFEEAVERARKRLIERTRYNTIDNLLNTLSQRTEPEKKISIPTLHGYEFVNLTDVIWCRSDGSYTTFYLTNQTKIISSRRLGHYEDVLFSNNFCRIHNSIIINMQRIKSYVKGKGGYVVMADGTELEISQRRKSDFLDKLTI
jgi:two-component system, LytTR family, response regulator